MQGLLRRYLLAPAQVENNVWAECWIRKACVGLRASIISEDLALVLVICSKLLEDAIFINLILCIWRFLGCFPDFHFTFVRCTSALFYLVHHVKVLILVVIPNRRFVHGCLKAKFVFNVWVSSCWYFWFLGTSWSLIIMLNVLLEYLLVEIKLSDKSTVACDVSDDRWVTSVLLLVISWNRVC